MPAADHESLKRLGEGRWETRDGRFTIEPESGTWVVVDNAQTDELGLPLVRGPYPSLTAARSAIARFRESEPAASPLAAQLEEARRRGADAEASRTKGKQSARARGRAAEREVEAEPEPPPEPKWLAALSGRQHREAVELIELLEAAGAPEAEAVARAEVTQGVPAVVRYALGRRLREIAGDASDPLDAVRRVIDLLEEGRDRKLGVRWQLVDDESRPVGRIDLPD